MKEGLLSVSTEIGSINIGDYIQALASSQFLKKIDTFIEREKLNEYDGEDIAMIMNGWYMHHPEHWPPSPQIHPLFISFHLNNLADNHLLNKESLDYLRQYEPIGCRDYSTVNKLMSRGIKAYFSGCMTLTLGYKYHSVQKDDKVYFTDPPVLFAGKMDKIKYLLYSVYHFNDKYRIYRKWYGRDKFDIRNIIKVSKFYHVYNNLFDRKLLLEAEYIQQEGSFYYYEYKTPQALLEKAEQMVQTYAKASCVVTSRIHCALPCLGLETPVLFINDRSQSSVSSCRLDGLLQLFNVVHYSNGSLVPFLEYDEMNKITKDNFPNNKKSWRCFADELIGKCNKFLAEIENH